MYVCMYALCMSISIDMVPQVLKAQLLMYSRKPCIFPKAFSHEPFIAVDVLLILLWSQSTYRAP